VDPSELDATVASVAGRVDDQPLVCSASCKMEVLSWASRPGTGRQPHQSGWCGNPFFPASARIGAM